MGVVLVSIKICILGCKILTIVSDQNLKTLLKEIFPGAYHNYFMVHISKNLMNKIKGL